VLPPIISFKDTAVCICLITPTLSRTLVLVLFLDFETLFLEVDLFVVFCLVALVKLLKAVLLLALLAEDLPLDLVLVLAVLYYCKILFF